MGEKNATRKMCGFLSEQERGVDVYEKISDWVYN